jgi:hypothetical protein
MRISSNDEVERFLDLFLNDIPINKILDESKHQM